MRRRPHSSHSAVNWHRRTLSRSAIIRKLSRSTITQRKLAHAILLLLHRRHTSTTSRRCGCNPSRRRCPSLSSSSSPTSSPLSSLTRPSAGSGATSSPGPPTSSSVRSRRSWRTCRPCPCLSARHSRCSPRRLSCLPCQRGRGGAATMLIPPIRPAAASHPRRSSSACRQDHCHPGRR